jgi:PKD repeat protein
MVAVSLSACGGGSGGDSALTGGATTPETPPESESPPPAPLPSTNQPPSAAFTPDPTGGLVALNVQLDASASGDVDGTIVDYRWSLGDGNSASGPSVDHVYTSPGTYTVSLTVTDDDGATDNAQTEIRVLESIDNSGGTVPNSILFFDDFEYAVSRDQPGARDAFVANGPWSNVKTYQDGQTGARGYLYTTESVPGYAGQFPGQGSNRVLAIEARPGTLGGQTDFYLQLGGGENPANDNLIPGDVWIQFWAYPQNYGDQRSRWDTGKFFYVCNSAYPCHSHKWMWLWGPQSYNPNMGLNPLGSPTDGEFLWTVRNSGGVSDIRYLGASSGDQEKLGQTDLSEHMVANRWTLVKMHFDTSTTSGAWEAWLKPLGGSWTKVAEWVGGVTPNFQWNVPAGEVGGHRVLRMPTTIGGTSDAWYDLWLYVDDFAIANSEAALPTYPY